MVAKLVFESELGNVISTDIIGDTIDQIDRDARIIVDLFDGVILSLTF